MAELVELVGNLFELAGIGVIVLGALWAVVRTVRLRHDRPLGRFRTDLAHAVLLGLELLVAADIVRTVAHVPSMESVLVLGLVVLIRTFLSISLEMEIEGRWPWQRARDERRSRRSSLMPRERPPPERPAEP